MLGGVPLALTPAPLILGAMAVFALPTRAAQAARVTGLAAVIATLALLGIVTAPVAGGGGVQASFGSPLPGIDYLFRADSTGVVIAFTAAVTALLVLVQPNQRRRRVAGVLLCATGGVAAGLAGNAVMLFGALEVGNAGAFAVLSSRPGRPSRGAVAVLIVEHLAALGLLAAAANLQATEGTSDFTVLPGSALTVAVATPWALAAALRLAAPLIAPLRGAAGSLAAWAATAAVPTGAAALLRLREAGGAGLPGVDMWLLAGFGALMAVGGAAMAARWRDAPPLGGRALCIAVAGSGVALAGLSGGAAATGLAAGLAALEVAVMAAPAWERTGAGLRSRAAGAAALLMAGGLPCGFGATALVLELTAAVTLGRPGAFLLIALLLAAALAAGASVAMAWRVLGGGAAVHLSPAVPVVSLLAIAVAAVGAVVPGASAAALARALAGGGLLAPVGAAAVLGPAGGWAGGYFVVALALVAAGALAASAVAGARLPRSWLAPRPAVGAVLPLRLHAFRTARRPLRLVMAAIPAVDAWVAVQPQLPLIAAGAVLAVLLIH